MPTLVGRPERSKDSRLKSRLDLVNRCGVLDLRPNCHGLGIVTIVTCVTPARLRGHRV